MKFRNSRLWRASVAAVAAAGMAVAFAACSSGAPGSGAGGGSSDGAGTGSLDGDGASIVVFMPTTSNSYIKADADAIKAEGDRLGYKVKVFENNFDQTEQDQQVQEWLATGEEPAGILFWPSAGEAATNSIRLLSQRAPVIQFNQGIQPSAEEFVEAYAGVSDRGIGDQAGKSALEAIEAQKAAGVSFHGPDGKPNLIEIRFPTGYVAGDERHEAFMEATGDAFNVLTVEPAKAPDAQSGFDAASQVIPQMKSQGIDFIYTQNNNIGAGVVQALEQNGLVPGKDVIIVAGDFSGDKTPLREGKIYSAVIQSPVIEGILVMRTMAQYLATGEVTDGTVNLETSEEMPELEMEPPARTTYMMNPPITKDSYDSFKIWGMGVDELVF